MDPFLVSDAKEEDSEEIKQEDFFVPKQDIKQDNVPVSIRGVAQSIDDKAAGVPVNTSFTETHFEKDRVSTKNDFKKYFYGIDRWGPRIYRKTLRIASGSMHHARRADKCLTMSGPAIWEYPMQKSMRAALHDVFKFDSWITCENLSPPDAPRSWYFGMWSNELLCEMPHPHKTSVRSKLAFRTMRSFLSILRCKTEPRAN